MLNINGITVRLGGRMILDRATAAIPPGARVGLIGRNGAGKSTLMKVMIGQLEADEGEIEMPRRTKLGYIAQDAPSGTATPFETVLAADTERAALLAEAENCADHDRLGDVYERLLAIDAYTADARAAQILLGLGFDEEMQAQPLDSYSGGWKMRVALAALLFSEPDVLLLDEPSNHLDLEATLWLENFLKNYSGTLVVISHERDLLNNVVDVILHLSGGKISLYSGNYDGFEKQRAERVAQIAAAQASQDSQRARLQEYVARNSARASTAKQAQSRAKMLAKMQPIASLADDPSLSFDFPSPTELRPPLITLDMAAVGYTADTPILSRLNLRIDPDDRVALLGRNGNGKTTLARLLAAQLPAMAGEIHASGKMKVGYFTQYQVEELSGDDSPLEHMTRAMTGKSPGAVRAQLGRFGFSGEKATTLVGKLSGGERARLALAPCAPLRPAPVLPGVGGAVASRHPLARIAADPARKRRPRRPFGSGRRECGAARGARHQRRSGPCASGLQPAVCGRGGGQRAQRPDGASVARPRGLPGLEPGTAQQAGGGQRLPVDAAWRRRSRGAVPAVVCAAAFCQRVRRAGG